MTNVDAPRKARVNIAFHADAVANLNQPAVDALQDELMRNAHYEPRVDFVRGSGSPNMTFSANLDIVPGWGHEPADWVALVESAARRHGVTLTDVTFEVGVGHRHIATLVSEVAQTLFRDDDGVPAYDAVKLCGMLKTAAGTGSLTQQQAWDAMPDTLEYGYSYVVHAGDLNSLYDTQPRPAVTLFRTRHKRFAIAAVQAHATHDVAAWFDVQEDAAPHGENRRTRAVDPFSLHVGDRVLLWMDHHVSDDKRSPLREVVIAAITTRDAYTEEERRIAPLIHWTPEPCDYYSDGSEDYHATCDAGYVIGVLHRAPWRTAQRQPVNVYARLHRDRTRLYDWRFTITYRRGGCVATHPYQLAQVILGGCSGLHVPDILDSDRFWAAWERAQRPGMRGTHFWTYDRNWNNTAPSVIANHHVVPGYYCDPDGGNDYWINVKAFRRWLLRAYPRMLRTPGEWRRESAQRAHDDYAAYVESEFCGNVNALERDREPDVEDDTMYYDTDPLSSYGL